MKNSCPNSALFLSIFCLFAFSNVSWADSDTLTQLKDCARTINDSKRIACYEALGKKALEADAVVEPVAKEKANTLPADLGGVDFADENTAEKEVEINRGRVTSCKKGASGKWFYFFENGQVWKQTDTRRRIYQGCDFYVDVWKDRFGYLMRVDGEKRKTAIKRHK